MTSDSEKISPPQKKKAVPAPLSLPFIKLPSIFKYATKIFLLLMQFNFSFIF